MRHISLFVSYLLNQVYPLVFLILLNQKFSASSIGKLILVQAFLSLVYAVIDYSSSIGIARSDKSLRFFNGYFFSRFFILMPITILASILFGTLSGTISDGFNLILLSVVLYGFNCPFVYQFLGKMKIYTVINFIGKALSILAIIIFETKDVLVVFGLSQIISMLPFAAYGLYVLSAHLRHVEIGTKILKESFLSLRNDFGIFFSSIVSISVASGLVLLCGYLFDHRIVAVIGIFDRIGKGVGSLFYPVSNLFLELRKSLSNTIMTISYISLLSIMIAGFFIIGDEAICSMFGCDLLEYQNIMYFYFLWIMFGLFNNVLGIQNLLLEGFSTEYSIRFLIAAMFSILSIFVFANVGYGAYSLVCSLIVSEVFLFVLLLKFYTSTREGRLTE